MLKDYGDYFVVTGTAGCGKSILMKHMLVNTLKSTDYVPIFIELRDINKISGSLMDLTKASLLTYGLDLDYEYFEKAFEEGHFIFFLDGYDEIDNNKRDLIRNNIFELVKQYPKCKTIVSSRPDGEFAGWKDFKVLTVNNLEVEEAIELISKLPYDEDIKKKFSDDLKSELFQKHHSFLSNPLLLSIMLLTYGQSANIPNKLSVFYNQAYEALFQRHDTYKGGFQRDRLLKMDIQDYCRVFSAFSVQTYDKREFQFSRIDALNHLSVAKKITNIDFKPELYLNDSLKSSCLLIEDGLFITFSHRSFQEYFTARFINEADVKTKKALLDKYSQNLRFDNVFTLLLEMNPEIMEKLFILPMLSKFFKMIGLKNKVGLEHFYKYMNLCFSIITVEKDNLLGRHHAEGKSSYTNFVFFVINNCGHHVGWKGFDGSKIKVDFFKKYQKEKSFPEFKLSELSENSEFIKDLYNNAYYFSKKTLELLLNINKAILEKHKNFKNSIEEILLK
ncbi:MAG: NACHT domain-containing protein [Ignavibacteriales bacterium]|nr:MAG: NACHT domain-containing protein [Ignavibacteriales bacterium]